MFEKWDERFTTFLRRFRRYDVELFYTTLYLWIATALALPKDLIQGTIVDILSFGAPRNVMAFQYAILFFIMAYTLWKNNKLFRKASLLIDSIIMAYIAEQVTVRSGLTIVTGMFVILSLAAVFTLWRFTANEHTWSDNPDTGASQPLPVISSPRSDEPLRAISSVKPAKDRLG